MKTIFTVNTKCLKHNKPRDNNPEFLNFIQKLKLDQALHEKQMNR